MSKEESTSEGTIICPMCETENDALRTTCANCGQSLIRVCLRCNTVNVITAKQCFACGQLFDTLGYIIARQEIRAGDRFTRHADTVVGVKEDEAVQAKARSDQLWEIERQRQAKLLEQKQRQKQQERYLIITTVIIVLVVLAAILLGTLAR